MDNWMQHAFPAAIWFAILLTIGALVLLAARTDGDALTYLSAGPGMGIVAIAVVWYVAWLFSVSVALISLGAAIFIAIQIADLARRGTVLWPSVQRRDFGFALGLGFAAIAWRAWLMRDLAFPPWVDSVQHGEVVRAFLDQRAVPVVVSTDLEIQLTYHWAFHAVAASMAVLMNTDVPSSLLSMGHCLVAILIVSTFAVCRARGCRTSIAVFASLTALFATNIPDQLVWWGRYTMLCGMCIVLSLFAFSEATGMAKKPASYILVPFFAIGAVLSHYFSAVLLVVWMIARILSTIFDRRISLDLRKRLVPVARLALFVAIGFVALSPWILRVGSIVPGIGRLETAIGSTLTSTFFPGYAEYWRGILGAGPSLVVAGLAIFNIRSVVWRPWLLWLVAQLLLSLPWAPFFVPFRPDYSLMTLWIVIWPLAGGASEAIARAAGQMRWPFRYLTLVIMVSLIIGGAGVQATANRRQYVFAYPDDLGAMSWIRNNVPQDSRFLISTGPWAWNLDRGMDGGWWITASTGRRTNLPALLFRPIEATGLKHDSLPLELCNARFWDRVVLERVDYLYVNVSATNWNTLPLANCPGSERVYTEGDVQIYRLSISLSHGSR